MEYDTCINLLLSKAQQKVHQQFKLKLAEYDLTPVQYGTLSCLWEQDGQSPGQIAAYLCLDSSTITGILDRLENKELLTRSLDRSDRRSLKIFLTDKGKVLREPIMNTTKQLNEEVLAILDANEKKALKTLLCRLSGE